MTSVLLYFWLAAANSGTTPSGDPGPLEPPSVNGPPAPTVVVPPPPIAPMAPVSSTPVGKVPIRRPPPLQAAPPAADPAPADPGPASTGDTAEAVPPPKAKASKKKPQAAAFAGRGVPVVLPSLNSTALKNELRQSLVQPGEVGTPVSDKARLEQLVTEITQAREALKQETARLEALIKQRGSCEGEARSVPAESSPTVAAAALAAKDMAREQLESVSKAMKGMKPEQAAAVLSLLDRRLAAEVLRRMRPADAGGVMGFLKPALAAELATEIATRKPTFGKKGATP
jgi:flagellar motility protein MotE (MotC chaperone)